MSKKKQKSKKKKWIIISAAAAVVVLLAVLLLPQFMRAGAKAADATGMTAEVSTGTIESTVVGSGNLSSTGTTDIKLPADVTIDSVEVETGDTVAAGDTLATLNAASLQSAISAMQDELDSIDSQIDSAKDETQPNYITSSLGGRVKRIFAAEGETTQAIISQNGSLMTLSIDGKMKVSFAPSSADSLSYGDTVAVTLSDASTVEGTVSALSSSSCTVTLTDNGPSYGESVSIAAEDGTALGSGTLEINTPIEVLGKNGVISSVNVSLNESISTSTKLMTLTEAAASSEYESLLAQRGEYERALRLLLHYAQTNSITADSSGIITAVSASGSSSSADSSGTATSSATQTSSATRMSAPLSSVSDDGDSVVLLSATSPEENSGGALLSDNSAAIKPIGGPIELFVNNPVTENTPQTTIMPGSGYTGKITWNPADPKFTGGTVYTATITLTAEAGYCFSADAQPSVAGAQVQNMVVSAEAEGNSLTFDAVFPATSVSSAQNQPSGEASSENNTAQAQTPSGYAASGGSSGFSGSSAGVSSGSSATVSATSVSTASGSEDSASLLSTVFTLQTGSADTLTVNIDELDILSVQSGQTATVVLDALPDQTFEGTVTKISDSGNVQSGVTTYPVTITLTDSADSGMKTGMNANATISIATSENVLLIPLDALQETGGEQFVFVADGSTGGDGMQGERRTVQTGLSDGTNVEIISGLSEGEQIIYTKSTSGDSSETMTFPGGNMPGGGMQGGGGQMPGGAPPMG